MKEMFIDLYKHWREDKILFFLESVFLFSLFVLALFCVGGILYLIYVGLINSLRNTLIVMSVVALCFLFVFLVNSIGKHFSVIEELDE